MIDLHLHLDGSLAPEEVLQLAELSGVSLPCRTADALRPLLEVTPNCRDLGEYLQKFSLPLQVLQTEETLALSVYFLIKRLAAQGLCYAEIRFAPQLHTERGLSQHAVVQAAVCGLQKAVAEFGMPAQLILCCMRGEDNYGNNLETVRVAKDFLHKGVCAADLAGNEAAYPTEGFAPVFQLARDLELPFIIHAGEAAGPESIRQALALGAQRIGHGIRATEDPTLPNQLKHTPLEMCFTSNLQTKAAPSAEDYPLRRFMEQGIPVTVNTDNMTVSATNLRKEYKLLQACFGLSTEHLQSLALNAAAAAFVTPSQKDLLQNKILTGFTLWLNA